LGAWIEFDNALDEPKEAGQEHGRNAEPISFGIDFAAFAAGRTSLAQWPQSLLPVGGRVAPSPMLISTTRCVQL